MSEEQPDIADIIAGELQTSRSHAYELMERALAARSTPMAGAEPPKQGEAALPSTPEEVIAFIGSDFNSHRVATKDGEPLDPIHQSFDVSVHDLLSAFENWRDFAPSPSVEPAPATSRSQKLQDAGFTRRDTRIECDGCGKLLSRLGLQVHECPPSTAPHQEPGWVRVPVDVTPEMIEAICAAHTAARWPKDYGDVAQAMRREDARNGWNAALAAAPKEPNP